MPTTPRSRDCPCTPFRRSLRAAVRPDARGRTAAAVHQLDVAPSLRQQRRQFLVVLPITALACLGFALLLEPALAPAPVRLAASALGLVVSGAFLAASCWHRSRVTVGRRRRSW